MGSFPCCYLLPLLVISLFINPSSISVEATQVLIDQVCFQVANYDFCNDTINANPRGPTADLEGLAQITIEIALANATNNFQFILQLLRMETDEAIKSNLQTCETLYGTIMDCFEEAFRTFDYQDYKSVIQYESNALNDPTDCENLFKKPPVRASPFADRNVIMEMLINMALAAAKLLH